MIIKMSSFTFIDKKDDSPQQQPQSYQANQPTYEYQNAQGQQMPPPNRQAPQQPPVIEIDGEVPF